MTNKRISELEAEVRELKAKFYEPKHLSVDLISLVNGVRPGYVIFEIGLSDIPIRYLEKDSVWTFRLNEYSIFKAFNDTYGPIFKYPVVVNDKKLCLRFKAAQSCYINPGTLLFRLSDMSTLFKKDVLNFKVTDEVFATEIQNVYRNLVVYNGSSWE